MISCENFPLFGAVLPRSPRFGYPERGISSTIHVELKKFFTIPDKNNNFHKMIH